MADFLLTVAVEKLTKLIIDEAVFLEGVSDQVALLRDDLQWMSSFLKDADAEQEKNEKFRTSQIREVALDAEDVIETYIYKASQSSWNLVAKLVNRHKVGKEIGKIQSRIENISSRSKDFGITSQEEHERRKKESTAEKLRFWRQTPPDLEEDDLVDLEEDTQALLTQLSSMEQRSCVVSIVGMGGLGKTTMAKKLYNHNSIKDRFDCKAFVYVSKEYNRRDILQRIIVYVSPNCNMDDLKKLEEVDLVAKLHELLNEKRYLVVLDDIWEKAVWDGLKDAFRSGKMGSKVLLTTRNMGVALHADARSKPHVPRMLTEDESFKLFRKKALPGMDHLPSDLEKLGREMVAHCDGLPLAVVVLGGLLSTKMDDAEEWRRVLQNISSHLILEERVSKFLSMSYNNLPFNLKACFLHLGLFPEDIFIPKTKLMQLWAAEGFLTQQQGKETTEDVAENCINELINTCMIQVGTRTSLGGRVKTIRIHDLLRDLSVSKGKDENFLGIYSGHNGESSSSQSTKPRRLAIHAAYNEYAFLNPHASHLRSLHFFNVKYPKNTKNFKLLRVLDGVQSSKGIGNLTQLRYLDLNYIKIPRSIGNLKKLQTLRLMNYGCIPNVIWKMKHLKHLYVDWNEFQWYRKCHLERLDTLSLRKNEIHIPNVIWKMKHLKHLYVNGNGQNLRLDTLKELQTLKGIWAGDWIEDGGLGSMISLQRLGILGLSREKVNLVIAIVAERLHHLQSLSLVMESLQSFPTPMTRFSHCEHLRKLHLSGRVVQLHKFPPNLVMLSLWLTCLKQDSVDKLGSGLPNLKMLVLGRESIYFLRRRESIYDSEKRLVFSSEGFPQLHILHLVELYDLKELIVEEGALINLKNLKMIRCESMKKMIIPEGLKLLTTLEGNCGLLTRTA